MSRWLMVSPFSCLMCVQVRQNQPKLYELLADKLLFWYYYLDILLINALSQSTRTKVANVLLLSAVPNEQQVKLLYLPNMF